MSGGGIASCRSSPISKARHTARIRLRGVGHFSLNGNLDTYITIRTALLKDRKACVQASGDRGNGSKPVAEFQEAVNQSKAVHPPQ